MRIPAVRADRKEASYFCKPPAHERPTRDLTSVLAAAGPNRGLFALSPPGTVTVEDDGFPRFTPGQGGKHRFGSSTNCAGCGCARRCGCCAANHRDGDDPAKH